MIEIGAGGGSIAARTRLGTLQVGPRSAAAAPGPACYGRGGTDPTVTDADLLMGYLDEHSFLGGSFALDRAAAQAALARLASKLGISLKRCAFGIHDVVNESMAEAAAMQASDSGVDPRTLPMIAFGGAGPVHAYGVARTLGVRKVICPLGAGVTSAIGLLGAPVAADLSASAPMALSQWSAAAARSTLDALAAQGREVVLASGVRAQATVAAGRLRGAGKGQRSARKGSRPVYFAESGGVVDTPVYEHAALVVGEVLPGPAIIEQRESTVVVGPWASASVDAEFNLIMLLESR